MIKTRIYLKYFDRNINCSNSSLSLSLILLATTFSVGAFLNSARVSADNTDVVDNVNITVPVSCSLSGTGMTSHNANIINGTYQADIGSTTLKAFCNDTNGFAIYAIGYTDSEYGKTVLTNSTLGPSADIATGTATSGSTSNWAMKLATDGTATYAITLDNSFGSYHAVPASYIKVAHRDSGTDIGIGAEGASLTSTYAAFMSQTQPAGAYTGKVKFTLIHPTTNAPNSIYIAQKVSEWAGTLSTGDEVTMMDARDGKFYTAAKLADGNIWMTQNLDFDLDSTKTYTSKDTDIPSGTTWTPSVSTHHDDTWQYLYNSPESSDPGDLYWNYDESLNLKELKTIGDSHYHIGNTYNFLAAIAENNMDSYIYYSTTPIERSICPAGWTLPRVGTGEDTFYSLWSTYGFTTDLINGDDKIWSEPLYFVFGRYWSSIFYVHPNRDADGPRDAFIDIDDVGSSTIRPSNYWDRDGSAYVRCVARPVTNTAIINT